MKVTQKEAKQRLRSGEILAVPTETVYSMAVDIALEEAILNLYNLKGRSAKKPLVIQVAKAKDILPWLSHVPFDLQKLTDAFWPGALTLVLPVKEESLSGLLRSNLPTAAFRVTSHPSTLSLLKTYGPLAITSANRSGEQDLLSSKEVEAEFGVNFPVLESEYEELSGQPSTILAYAHSSWVVLRLGEHSLESVAKVLGYYPAVVDQFDPKSLTYQLRIQLHLKDTPYDGSIKVVLGFKEREYKDAEVIELGSLEDPKALKKSIATRLKELHTLDHPHVWVDMNFPKEGQLREVAEILERSSRRAL